MYRFFIHGHAVIFAEKPQRQSFIILVVSFAEKASMGKWWFFLLFAALAFVSKGDAKTTSFRSRPEAEALRAELNSLRDQIKNSSQDYEKKVELSTTLLEKYKKYLDLNHIAYDVISYDGFPAIIIRPIGKHRLGQASRFLQKTLNAQLLFCPHSLARANAGAMAHKDFEGRPALLGSLNFLINFNKTSNEGHEFNHLRLFELLYQGVDTVFEFHIKSHLSNHGSYKYSLYGQEMFTWSHTVNAGVLLWSRGKISQEDLKIRVDTAEELSQRFLDISKKAILHLEDPTARFENRYEYLDDHRIPAVRLSLQTGRFAGNEELTMPLSSPLARKSRLEMDNHLEKFHQSDKRRSFYNTVFDTLKKKRIFNESGIMEYDPTGGSRIAVDELEKRIVKLESRQPGQSALRSLSRHC